MRLQPDTPLHDAITETYEMFQNAGIKGEKHSDPSGHRVNKQKGYGTNANDRSPILGTVGRASGQARLRIVKHMYAKT